MSSQIIDVAGCWIWQGGTNNYGYPYFYEPGDSQKPKLVHRYLYALAKGPIPSMLVLDHICEIRKCVNPEHLRAIRRFCNTVLGQLNGFTYDELELIAAKAEHLMSRILAETE